MATLRNDTVIRSADGQGTSAIVTASNIGSYGVATNSTYYVGTTQNIFNRASGAQTLTGVSIDGNAATVSYPFNNNNALDLNSTGTTNQFSAFNVYYPSGGSYNQPIGGSQHFKILQFGRYNADDVNYWRGQMAMSFYTDRMFFRKEYTSTWGSWMEFLHTGNYAGYSAFTASLTSTVDARAPIFYDSANTAYYLDPANTGTSLLVAGNVGIGTTSPATKLEVASTSDGILTLNKSSGTAWNYINFSQAGTRRFYFGLNASFEPELGVDNGGTFRVVGGMTVAGNAVLTSTSTLTAGNLSGTIPSGVLGNSTHYVGTTAIALNRASASQTLTGVSIDGNAATATNGLTTSNYVSYSAFTGSVSSGGNITATSYIYTSTYLQTGGNLIYPSGYGATQRLEVSNAANNTWIDGITIAPGGIVTAPYEMRSPIFYDSNDTTYYIDPASTSRVVALWVRGSSETTGNIYIGGTSAGNRLNINYDQIWTSTGHLYLQYSGAGNIDMNTGGGHAFSRTSLRAPIFYDFDNTAYYVDPASTSVLNKLTIDGGNYANNYFQSFSDFTSGTLVTTDIPATAAEGESFVMNVIGKSYSSASPFDFSVQGYLYNSTIINYSGIKLDSTGLTSVKIFQNGGVLCFWWPTVTYWNGFEVSVRAYNSARSNYNRVTNITNSTEPVGTKKVAVTLQSFLRADASATNSVDLRAPIFYDSNDTAYYTDPSSLSNILELKTNKNWYDSSASAWGGGINMGGNNPSIGFQSTASTWWYMLHHSSSAINFYRRSTSGSWNHDGIWDSSGNFIWQGSSVRAPIFYDQNNTTYYLDPANSGTSLLVAGKVGIGTTSPGALLEVSGTSGDGVPTFKVTSTAAAGAFNWAGTILNSSLGSSRNFILFIGKAASTKNAAYIGYNHSGTDGSNTNFLTLGHYASDNLLNILGNGNVGIGTTSPSWLLTVYAASAPQFTLSNATRNFILTNNAGDGLLSFNYASVNRLQFDTTNQWFNTGNVGIGTTDFSYTINDNSRVVGSNTNNRLFVSGSIQLLGNNDAIVFGRGTSTFLTDEELGFGWGGGWYMTDETYLRIRNNKLLYTTGEIWASAFKDSNDTTYYLNPADVSYLYEPRMAYRTLIGAQSYDATLFETPVTTRPGVVVRGIYPHIEMVAAGINNVNHGATLRFVAYDTANATTGDFKHWVIGCGGTNATGLYFGYSPNQANPHYGIGRGWSTGNDVSIFWILNDREVYAENGVRATIFYDRNDTTYYTDPASTSVLYNLSLLGAKNTYLTINPGNGSEAMVRYIGGSGSGWYVGKRMGSQLVGTADFHFFSEAAGATIGGIDTSGNIFSTGSVRSPIFYDSNDTNYYVDPASTSILNGTRHNTVVAGSTSAMTSAGQLAIYSSASPYISFHDGGVGRTAYMQETGGGFYFGEVTYTESEGSFRAPLFYDSNNTAYYIDPAAGSLIYSLTVANDANLELYKSQTVDMSNVATYSISNYYPVLISVPTEGCIIQIQNNLNSNVPSWSTHGGGFTLNLRWRTNGSGWGTTAVRRYIEQYHERFASTTICGGITQMGHSSIEVVWLRGGGQYYFKFSRNLTATAQATAYTLNSQTVTPTPTAQNTIWNSYEGGWTLYNDTTYSTSNMYTPVLYDYNNSAYYVDPASTSNLVGLTVANTITGSVSGTAGSISGFNNPTTAATANTIVYRDANGHIFGNYILGAYFNSSAGNSENPTIGQIWTQSGSDNYLRKSTPAHFRSQVTDGSYPSLTGANASGTWSINVTGNAGGSSTSCTGNAASVTDGMYLSGTQTITGVKYFQSNLGTTLGSLSGPPLQAYATGTNAAFMSFHRSGSYAVNFGLDSDNVLRIGGWSASANRLQLDMGGNLTVATNMYANGFYDNNNTALYCDPNGTSLFTGLTVTNTITGSITGNAGGSSASCTGNSATTTLATKATRANGNFYIDDNYGNTVVGVYSASRYQGVYAMGDSYKLAADGSTTGSLYGIAWSHPNAGGAAGNLSNHGALILLNGGYAAAISSSIRCTVDMRTPIYYDSDNTSYYIDAGSTSYLYVLSVASAATAADYYTAGWFRSSTSGHGMYNQVTGQHFYSDSANYWNVASSASEQGIRLRTGGHAGTVRGYFYADTANDVGLLNQAGSWRVRVVGGDYVLFDGSSIRAQIFYDSNDTGYYTDPAGTSILNVVRANSYVQKSASQSLSGTVGCTIDVAAAGIHVLTLAASTTISSFTYNYRAPNPSVNTIMLVIKYGGTASITWTNVLWANGVTPTITGVSGYADVYMLTSYQGTTGVWIGTVVSQGVVSTSL